MAEQKRVVFHQKLKAVRERFGDSARLHGLSTARRRDNPLRPLQHFATIALIVAIISGLTYGLLRANRAINAWFNQSARLTISCPDSATDCTTSQAVEGSVAEALSNMLTADWIGSTGLDRLFTTPSGALMPGGVVLTMIFLLLAAIASFIKLPHRWPGAIYRSLNRLFGPAYKRLPYALYLRRNRKAGAPGPLDLSVAGEAKFIRAFQRIGPTVAHGTNAVDTDDPPGTVRISVPEDDDVWKATVSDLGCDAALIVLDVVDATDRVLWQVRRLGNVANGPRYAMLIAIGTPERRMSAWRAVAQAIAGSTAKVTPVAPKAPPSVMLIDGETWTAVGQAPHALSAAQLSATLQAPEAQALLNKIRV